MATTKNTIVDFLKTNFPQTLCIIEEVKNDSSIIRYPVGEKQLRPGGTVSGPVMMEAADVGLYVAILGKIGLVGLAVTTNLTINFLRKPKAKRDIIAKSKLIKVGKSLVVGEVEIFSEGDNKVVAHVVATYSLPPKR